METPADRAASHPADQARLPAFHRGPSAIKSQTSTKETSTTIKTWTPCCRCFCSVSSWGCSLCCWTTRPTDSCSCSCGSSRRRTGMPTMLLKSSVAGQLVLDTWTCARLLSARNRRLKSQNHKIFSKMWATPLPSCGMPPDKIKLSSSLRFALGRLSVGVFQGHESAFKSRRHVIWNHYSKLLCSKTISQHCTLNVDGADIRNNGFHLSDVEANGECQKDGPQTLGLYCRDKICHEFSMVLFLSKIAAF